MRLQRPPILPLLFLPVWLASCAPLLAAQWLVFDDGRGLKVEAVRFEGDIAHVALEEGGTITVPAVQIAAVEWMGDPAPVAPATAEAEVVEALAEELSHGDRWMQEAGPYAPLIAATADRYGLERALLAAVAKVESNFDPYAVSNRGACGIVQLLPSTAERFGVANLFDPAQNLEGGARYLRWLLDRFEGRLDLALAGYNAGEGAVEKYQGVPPYRETRGYVSRVIEHAGASTDGP